MSRYSDQLKGVKSKYSAEQKKGFSKQYRENRAKGFTDYKEKGAGGGVYDATGSRLHALTLDSPKQKKKVKDFDNSNMYVGEGQSWRPEYYDTSISASENKVPELKTSSNNLRNQGYSSSFISTPLNFDGMSDFDRQYIQSESLNRKRKAGSSFTDAYFLPSNPGTYVAPNKETQDYFFNKYGMSMDNVLDQYDQYEEDKKRESRENSAFLSGLPDFATAPQRALQGFMGGITGLTGDNFVSRYFNNDANMRDVKEVQKNRDYSLDSDKISEGKKNLLEWYYGLGDTAVNAGFFGSGKTAGSTGTATQKGLASAQQQALEKQFGKLGTKGISTLARGMSGYGLGVQEKRHKLEKAGVDPQTAYKRAQATGAIEAATQAYFAAMGGAASAASEGATNTLKDILLNAGKKALSKGTEFAEIGAAKQAIEEAADILYLKNEGAYSQDKQRLMAQGLSEEDAEKQAAINLVGRVFGSGATGFAMGAVPELIGGGASVLKNLRANGNTNPGTALAVSNAPYDDALNNVYGDFQKTLGTANAGLIGEYSGYPGIPQLSDSGEIINLPDVSSGPAIQMPNTSSGPAIPMFDMSDVGALSKITRDSRGDYLTADGLFRIVKGEKGWNVEEYNPRFDSYDYSYTTGTLKDAKESVKSDARYKKPAEVPALEAPAEAISAPVVAPAEVDPNNVIYHAGTLSRYNKADTAGRMEGMRGTGYYGTGYYFVDGPHKKEISKGSSYGDKPFTSVDISKYNNLFRVDTDAKANELHDFSKGLMRYVNGYNDSQFIDSDFGVDEEALAEYIDKIYGQYVDLFGDKAMSREDFFNRLNEMRNEYEYDFYDRGDSTITTFMREHGYNGVDTRGTRSADTERGIVLYDLLEDSVLQSHVTDEAAKNGLMNTRIDTGNPVFDPETDAKLKADYEGSIKAKEVRKEYLKLYDEKKLKKLEGQERDLNEKIYNLENNVLPHEREMAKRGDYYEEEMDRKYLATKRMFPEMSREEFDAMHEEDSELDAIMYDDKTPVQFFEDRLKAHKKELAKVQKSLKAEEKKAKAAREKARDIVNSRSEEVETIEDDADLAPIPEADLDAAVANEVANELPQLAAEDVINEDIVPDIDTAVANTRNYTDQEIAEISAYVDQKNALKAEVASAAKNLLNTNPADLQRIFSNMDALNAEMYGKYPELFANGKFVGMSEVDKNANSGYNVGTGGTANGLQVSGGYDGRGSNAVAPGIREPEPQDQGIDRTLQEGGLLLPNDRGAITEQLRSNPAVTSPEESSTLSSNGIPNQPFYDASNNADVFTQALATAKVNNPNGASVDGHSLEEIQAIVDNGGSCFLTDDATAGGAVESNGNLTCVFKDKTANKTPEMGTAVALAAIKKGATKGDCFGRFLVNTYSLAGFEPVARVNYAYGINEDMDAYVDKMIAEGKFQGPPDVYAFKLRDGYDYDTAVAAHNDKTKAIAYTQEQLDALRLFEGEDSYDEMLAYRDSLLEKQSTQAASSNEGVPFVQNDTDRDSYFLRLLGDPEFLQDQARVTGYDPQTLVAYANQNLGYSNIPFVSNQQSTSTTPPTGVPFVEPETNGTEKTSKYYDSTMRNTAENQDMSDKEYGSRFKKEDFGYKASTEDQSVEDANNLIKALGGEEKATKVLSDPEYFKTREYTHVHVDAIQTLANAAEARAKALDAQGLDSAAAWRDANRLHKMAQRGGSNSAQALQALKKWKMSSPRAQVDHLVAEINTAIDQNKTKGYTNMVYDLADKIEDAISEGGSTDDIIARVRKVFDENSKNSNYSTKKIADKVIKYIRNADKNPDLVEEASNIVKKNMGVSTMTYQQEIAIAEMLEMAGQYPEGSRSYNELVARAMKMFDETLPADSIGAKARSIIYDNMLLSIRTMFTRNLGGNVVANSIDFLERPLMVGTDVVASKFTGNRTRSLTGKAIIEGAKGFGHGVADWGRDIGANVNTARSGQGDLETVLKQNHNTFRTNSDNQVINGANIALHMYDRLVRKGMELGDRPIYEMRYAATKAELLDVVDRFGDEGLRKGLGLEKVENLDTNDLIEYLATGEALESVLQNDSKMKEAAQALKQFFKKSSEGALGVDVASLTMTPFIEVPANMADVMFQHTPVGIASNIIKSINEKKKYGSVNQRRMTKEAGRNLGGLAITGALTGAAAGGAISGALSEDKDERKMQQNNGFQEYALQTPDASTQIDISDIPVLGPMVQYSKRLYDAYSDNGIKGAAEEIIPALGAVTVDQLYQSLNRLTGATNKYSSANGSLLENAVDAIKSSAASMAIPQLVRQTAQFTDPYKRDLGDYGTNEYNWNLFLNGIPGVRQATLQPKVDTSGNYVPELGGATGADRFAAAYINPWKISHPFENMSDVQKYAMALNLSSDGEVNPQMPVFNKSDLTKTKGFDENSYSHEALRLAQEDFYNANTELGDALINQSWFRELTPELQGKYLDKLFSANKANAKYNAVRSGKTEAEIAALGDQLYTPDDKLAEVIRNDNASHTKALMWIKDQAELDAINKKYGTNMNHSTFEKKENESVGGADSWAKDTVPAKELGYDVDDYRRYEAEYPGGAKQRKADEQEAQKNGLSLDQYNKLKEKAGSKFNEALEAHNQLKKKGLDKYNVGLDYTRSSGFTYDEFADLYHAIDTSNNQAFSQTEVLDYLNNNNIKDESLAQRIWAIAGFTSKDGTKQTKLIKGKNGKWKSGY